MHHFKILFFSLLALAFSSCDTPRTKVDVSGVDAPLELLHFERDFLGISDSEFGKQWATLQAKYPPFFEGDNDSTEWYNRHQDTFFLRLYEATQARIDYQRMQNELSQSWKYLKYYFPEEPLLPVITYVSGLDIMYPVLPTDKGIFIASDIFLGAEFSDYVGVPDYIRLRMDQDYLTAKLLKNYFSLRISFNRSDASFINHIIHHGKLLYASHACAPFLETWKMAEYTEAQWEWCMDSEASMWVYFLQNNLLFSPAPEMKTKFIDEAPFSKFGTKNESDSPGRVGQWIGFRIVESYMNEHPELSLKNLLMDVDNQAIFANSKYKPLK